jgi:hypothetical protein
MATKKAARVGWARKRARKFHPDSAGHATSFAIRAEKLEARKKKLDRNAMDASAQKQSESSLEHKSEEVRKK